MAVAIKISRTCQTPAGRQGRTERGANDNVVVKVSYYCLMRGGVLNHKVRVSVIVKIGHHSPRGWRGKTPVGAVGRSTRIAGYDSEMIRRARSQAADIRSDVLRRAALVILSCRAGAVVRRGSILEMNSGNRSVWIDRAIERS
jgi:hypothetical protein